MKTETVYFESPGDINTDEAHKIVRKRADELGIGTVIVASTSGKTGLKAMDVFDGLKVIVVGHAYGFRQQPANTNAFEEDKRKIIESRGGTVLHATHTFGGLSRAALDHFNGIGFGEIVAHTLRIFGAGTKVACEITTMAADAGYVRTDEDVIALAGTGKHGGGTDTAIVLRPANAHDFFNLKVKEIICKPVSF